MSDDANESATAAERKRRRNRFVMAGSVAPKNAAWLFPRSGLADLPEKPRRRARIAMGIALMLTAALLTLVLTGHGRLAAYALLLSLALYVVACLAVAARLGLTRHRQSD